MNSTENQKKRWNLKSILKNLDNNELMEIIIELSKINVKNKEFLEIFLKSSDEIDFNTIINDAKKKIYVHIYGRSIYSNNCLKLKEAKKVISDNSKILKNYPLYIADLKLYYVETCNDFTKDFGDISEQFYDSVISTFDDFCSMILQNPILYGNFKARLEKLYKNSRNIGWNYSDFLGDLLYRLVKEINAEFEDM